MKSIKYLLIGGGLASNSAAKTLRKCDADGTIAIVTNEAYLPYNRPPLSKDYLKGKIIRERLFFDSKVFYEQNYINVILNTAVEKIDLSEKIARVSSGDTIQFDKVLVATGGHPTPLPIPGTNLGGVAYIRTLDDTDSIARLAQGSQKAVIIGGGFIGLELAASLTVLGITCEIIELQSRIWSHFAPKLLSTFFQDYCSGKGVKFHLEEKVSEILGKDGKVNRVRLESNKEIPCDMVCIGIGIVPNTELAIASGLEVDNGIVVNENLRSSHADVYAAGDVSNYIDSFSGNRKRVEHWGHAKFSGQCAAYNMMGESRKYEFLSYVWSEIFDVRLNFAGDESDYDEILTRGCIKEGAFSLLFLKENLLTGGFTINVKGAEFAQIKRLILERTDLKAKKDELLNPQVDLGLLL